ncbi:MAG: lysophospholipid acyltransferase family protein [Acidobacteriota bacterium]
MMGANAQGGLPAKQQNNRGAARPFTWAQRAAISLLSFLGWQLVWILGATLRWKVEGWDRFEAAKQQKKPLIYCFWHNQILSATHFWRFRNIVVITSQHFDGEAIAGIIKRFGYGSARGSSSRGAAKALLELKRCIDRNKDVAFAADGPRGPAYRVKPGPVWLSRKTGAAILPFHIQPQSYWSLNSWDGFCIPKPFSRVLVKIGPPLAISPEEDEETGVAQVQSELDRIQRECEAHW